MKYLNLIFTMLLISNLSAQYSDNEQTVMFNYDLDYEVQLDTSITENQDHVYSDYLSEQNADYIQWVYQVNEQKNKSIDKQTEKAVIINDKGNNNSLIFTLVKNGLTTYDTLSNLLEIDTEEEPKKISFFRKLWNKITIPNVRNILEEQNIKGSLPKGCMTWVNANSRRLKCGVEIIKSSSAVTMILLNNKGELVHVFADSTLYRGWNNYTWNRDNHKKGKYTLSITIDGENMTQDVKIK